MRDRPIIRWTLEQLLHLALYIIGVPICMMIYPFRDWIRTNDITILWYFLNDTKKKYESDVDFGDFGRFKSNYIGFLRQCAFRNSHWNLRLLIRDEIGPMTNKVIVYNTTENPFMFCNLKIHGKQKVFYTVNGVRYFRMSKSVIWMNGTRLFNYQFGNTGSRSVFKIRNVKFGA